MSRHGVREGNITKTRRPCWQHLSLAYISASILCKEPVLRCRSLVYPVIAGESDGLSKSLRAS
eukprot:5742968-Karenia_brevis.AAC.1